MHGEFHASIALIVDTSILIRGRLIVRSAARTSPHDALRFHSALCGEHRNVPAFLFCSSKIGNVEIHTTELIRLYPAGKMGDNVIFKEMVKKFSAFMVTMKMESV